MKKIFSIFLLLCITASIKTQKQNENLYEKCVISCGIKNLSCFGVIERNFFNGKTEFDEIIEKQIFSVCGSFSNEQIYPTGI